VTGFLSRGDAGSFQDAINLSQATGLDASDALAAVRHYQSRPGVSINLEQQVSDPWAYLPVPAGPTAMSSRGISRISTARLQGAFR
jgi:hypothetical protein